MSISEQIQDDVLKAVREALAGDSKIGYPTVSSLARFSEHDAEDIETALRTLQDVGDVRLDRIPNGPLCVTWVRPPS